MPGSDGISTRISVLGDKEYKKALQDIGRRLTVLNTEMAATDSAFDGQAKSMEAMQAKAGNLQSVYETHAQKVKLIAEQLNKAKAEYGENSKQADNLQIALNRAVSAMNKAGNEIKKNDQAMAELSATTEQTGDSTEDMADAAEEAGKAMDTQAKSADDAESKISRLRDAMAAVGGIAGGALKASLKIAAGAIMALGTSAIAGGKALNALGTDFQQATNQLSAQTSATGAQLESLGAIAQEIWQDNFGENIADVNDALATTKVNTGLLGEELKTATKNGYLLRDTFGMEIAESSRTATALMKNFGISAEDAYNLIAVGAQNGANRNGDLLDVLSEYSPMFAGLGLSSDQFISTLIAGAESGAFSIDKVADAVKEFSIRAVDGSDTTKQAFKDLGLNAKQLSADFAAGGPAAQEAFSQVVAALNGVEDPLKRSQIAVSLFGTQFEDLGPGVLSVLGNISSAAAGGADALGQINAVRYDDAQTALEGLKRNIQAQFLPLAQEVSTRITETLNGISAALADGFQPEDIYTIGNDIASNLFAGINSLGTLISDNAATFSAFAGQIVGLIAQALPGLVDAIFPAAEGLLQAVLDGIVSNAEPIGAMAGELIGKIVGFLIENAPGMIDAAGDIITGLVDGLLSGDTLAKLVPAAIEMIAKLAASLVENAGELLAKAPEIIGQLIEGFQNTDWSGIANDLISGLSSGISTAASALKDSLMAPFDSVITWVKELFGIASPSTVMEGIGDFILQGLSAGLSAGVEAVLTTVGEVFGRIWDAIKSFFGFGDESQESQDAKQAGTDLMTGMKQGVEGSEADLEQAVRNAAQTALTTIKTELGIEGESSTKTKAMGEALVSSIGEGLSGASEEDFSPAASQILGAVQSAINSAFGVHGTGFLGTGGNTASVFIGLGESVCKAIADGISANNSNTDAVKQAITGVANAAYEAAVAEMATGLTGGTDTVNAAVDAVASAALEAAGALLNAESGEPIGLEWAGGIAGGVRAAAPDLTSAGMETAALASDAASVILSQSAGSEIGGAFAGAISQGITGQNAAVSASARELGTSALSALREAVGEGGSKFKAIGTAIATGVARGIDDGSSKITQAAREAARKAYDAAKRELGIASPSKRMMQIGLNYAEGFARGIESGVVRLARSAQALSDSAALAAAQAGTYGAPGPSSGLNYRAMGEEIAAALNRSSARIEVTQNIYAKDTSYAGQQREAARNMQLFARALG